MLFMRCQCLLRHSTTSYNRLKSLERLEATPTRRAGPVFLSSLRPSPARAPAAGDICPVTGRARLSYHRAAELLVTQTGWTLHQFRHSALTHLAEDNVQLPLLMAKSRQRSLRTLQRYAAR